MNKLWGSYKGTSAAGRVFDPKTGALRTLELKEVPPPPVSPDAAPVANLASSQDSAIPKGATLVVSDTAIAPTSATLHVRIQLPPGYHLTKGANSRFEASALGPGAQGDAPAITDRDCSCCGISFANLA